MIPKAKASQKVRTAFKSADWNITNPSDDVAPILGHRAKNRKLAAIRNPAAIQTPAH